MSASCLILRSLYSFNRQSHKTGRLRYNSINEMTLSYVHSTPSCSSVESQLKPPEANRHVPTTYCRQKWRGFLCSGPTVVGFDLARASWHDVANWHGPMNSPTPVLAMPADLANWHTAAYCGYKYRYRWDYDPFDYYLESEVFLSSLGRVTGYSVSFPPPPFRIHFKLFTARHWSLLEINHGSFIHREFTVLNGLNQTQVYKQTALLTLSLTTCFGCVDKP
jgi:hypothetical protein